MDMRVYRASSLGSACLRGLVAEQLGEKAIPHDEKSELRMAEGNLHESDVIARLVADGYAVNAQQEEVNLPHPSGAWNVQGHLDGVVSGLEGVDRHGYYRVLEIKSTSDAEFKKFQASAWETPGLWQKYKWQLSVYMLATGLEALFVVKNRNSGELLRMGVEMPFHTLDEITERIAFLELWVERGELPPDCPRDFWCPWKYMCDSKKEQPDGQTTGPAPSVVSTYVSLGRQITALEAERDLLKPELEALLGTAQSVQWDGYKASRVTQNRKERVVPASTVSFIKVTKEKTE